MFTPENSILVVIDVQGKLARMVEDHEKVTRNIRALVTAAKRLDVPILLTEQAPDKIGETIPEITDLLDNPTPIIKPTFSCCGIKEFNDSLKNLKRKEIIVCGIETHVCVYQTVADLLSSKFKVQVVVDAVSSRGQERKDVAIARMNELGAGLTTAEMIITELLHTTEHPHFREILGLLKS